MQTKCNSISTLFAICLILVSPIIWAGEESKDKLANPSDLNDVIEAKSAKRHYGEVKTVCGRVRSTSVSEHIDGDITFLHFGRSWPNHHLAVVVRESAKRQSTVNLDRLAGKDMCVVGMITKHQRRPMIIVEIADQLGVVAQ